MFQFVYKMFGDGYAALPADGIQAIPNQLKAQLQSTSFNMNTPVKEVNEKTILLENGQSIQADAGIIATDPSRLLSTYVKQEVAWHSCYNFYFKTDHSTLEEPIIGLVADEKALVNNLYFTTDVIEQEGSGAVLSATVVRQHDLSEAELIEQVKQELKAICRLEELTFLKVFTIKKALPRLKQLKYQPSPEKIKVAEGLYVAGDYTANPSLNAAMLAGKVAANSLIADLQVG
jgi:protoporphyrinogen oxidase